MTPKLRKGRQPKEHVIYATRSLTRADLEVLKEKRVHSPVKSFKDTHHNLARLVAAGLRGREIATRSGYSHSRVNGLLSDPAFTELVAHYRKEVTKAYAEGVDSYFELITDNMIKAERLIADRLEDAEEEGKELPVRELIMIGRDAADRAGYGKKQTNLNVNVDFAAKLEQTIARSGKVLDVTPKQPALPPSAQPHRGPGMAPRSVQVAPLSAPALPRAPTPQPVASLSGPSLPRRRLA